MPLADRLRRLGVSKTLGASAPSSSGTPSDRGDSRREASPPTSALSAPPSTLDSRFPIFTAEGPLGSGESGPGLTRVTNSRGSFWLLERLYPLSHPHGLFALGAPLDADARALGILARDRRFESFEVDRSLFIDTETTGLSGGTGTVAFLIGAGFYEPGGFRVQQLFMADFDEEAAMLEHLAGLLAERDGLISYNGRSFDMPLLASRFIANRMRLPGPDRPHLDLLHAGRRLWRYDLPDLTLGQVERRILGIARVGDVGGAFIPALYFRFLTERDAAIVQPILEHNSIDVLSLASVLAAGVRVCEGAGARGGECLGLARTLDAMRERAAAVGAYRRALELAAEPALERRARKGLARALARAGDRDRASEEWYILASRFEDLDALEALAKSAEHRQRDPRLAVELVDRALARLASPLLRGVASHLRRRQSLLLRRARLARLTAPSPSVA